MESDVSKSPRIYVDQDLTDGGSIELADQHVHYLLKVLRLEEGEPVRVFNGRDGEFIGEVRPESKKQAALDNLTLLYEQPEPRHDIHLYFAPIKKDRLQFLIEKAVELGVTDLHPVITTHTENRKPNMEKAQAYIIEAAEQCERMDIPALHPIKNMVACHFHSPTFAAIEREEYGMFESSQSEIGILIGPEGGFSDEERGLLNSIAQTRAVSLGPRILRADTAAVTLLSITQAAWGDWDIAPHFARGDAS